MNRDDNKSLYQDISRPRVLVVDDDQFSQVHITNRILERYDVGLIVVYTIPEAIEILKSIKIDYCLLDHRFPLTSSSGLDVVRHISKLETSPKTFVVTVVEKEVIMSEYAKYRVDGVISKVRLADELNQVFSDKLLKAK